MNDDYFKIEDLNELWTKFRRTYKSDPTQLVIGSKEYEDIQGWAYEYYNPNRGGSYDKENARHKKYIEELHTKPFGLELVKVDKESYLELK